MTRLHACANAWYARRPSVTCLVECRLRGELSKKCIVAIEAQIVERVKRHALQSAEDFTKDPLLEKTIEAFRTCQGDVFPEQQGEVFVHLYQTKEVCSDCEQYRCVHLPCAAYENMWETLHFEGDIHERVLAFVAMCARLVERRVDPVLIPIHRLVLLHGPPGSGKTSLCRAVAQKIAIRASHLFGGARTVALVEVQLSSLFSKWFSESSKLIEQLFSRIEAMASEPGMLLFVLLDEVESVAAVRCAEGTTGEPMDALRAVNVLLQQLDLVRIRSSNVLILATSNLKEAIDPAFLDRVDWRVEVGAPSAKAIEGILRESICELQRVDLVGRGDVDLRGVAGRMAEQRASGRWIRKLPVLALSQSATDIGTFIRRLEQVAEESKGSDY